MIPDNTDVPDGCFRCSRWEKCFDNSKGILKKILKYSEGDSTEFLEQFQGNQIAFSAEFQGYSKESSKGTQRNAFQGNTAFGE